MRIMNRPEDRKPIVKMKNVQIEAGGRILIPSCSLDLYGGQRIALMGTSGIGKTTLLKVIAGILPVPSGTLIRNGSVSMVFDQDGLCPDLSARENIELGLPWTRHNKEERKHKAEEWGTFFGCEAFLDQKVSTLSAGQRKRTGLARAMMKEPDLLLLDETFHALDPNLRKQLGQKILELQKKHGFALVFATHNEREADFLNAQIVELTEDGEKGISTLVWKTGRETPNLAN